MPLGGCVCVCVCVFLSLWPTGASFDRQQMSPMYAAPGPVGLNLSQGAASGMDVERRSNLGQSWLLEH